MRIAVAGGTGVVGRHVVDVAEERGHDVLVLSRASGVDLTSGAGLAGRLEGVEAVVDVVSTRTPSRKGAEAFFRAVTEHLLEAERSAGVGHHVVLSIVGIDRVPNGYYQGKQLQERLTVEGDVPWTLLRATQFHEFAEQALGLLALGPFSVVPSMLIQPVAAREVAAALVDHVEAGPSGRAPDLAGPEVHQLVDLARRVNQRRRLGRRVVGLRVPGAWGRGMRQGDLTVPGPGPRGTQTFEEWLQTLAV